MSLDQNSGILVKTNTSGWNDWSFGTAPTPGSTVVVAIGSWLGNTTPGLQGVSNITDNQAGGGNTYTKRAETYHPSGGGTSVWVSIWVAENVASSGTFTITTSLNSGGNYCQGGMASFTGNVNFDVSGTGDDSSTLSGTRPTISTGSSTAASVTLISIAASSDNSSPQSNVGITSLSGYTDLFSHQSQADTVAMCAAYDDDSSGAGTKTMIFDHITAGASFWSAAIISLKPAAGGTTPPTLHYERMRRVF